MLRKTRIKRQDAELDITSFMNLMIVLVPVLLMMMVFSHITVLDLKLPELTDPTAQSENQEENEDNTLELMVRDDQIEVYYPKTYLLKTIPNTNDDYDYDTLVAVLKQVKQLLSERGIDKKDISILLEPQIDYQTIVTLMDKSRSYKAVVVASVVDAELFPEISLGDALQVSNPELVGAVSAEGGSK
ncbi:biopolymer transporter ExbD [Thalassotalea ponticola]|uniref:ExbD/TolR family protein n=1 Tax=Thalassotalea ponticola TaxID=1523392 RepID=UPI0025B2B236|nr:biopolymer transporter ExbD [Thalassotalea ponticola]MDN3652683.1 biopolymer transporter ExbD [Thalassotalea ponticola]